MKKFSGIIIFFLFFLWTTSVISAGKCIKGDCKNGYGVLDYSSYSFEGNFVNGQSHGLTKILTKNNGHIYVQKYDHGRPKEYLINEETIKITNEFSSKEVIKINTYIHILNLQGKPTEGYVREQVEIANKVWKQANIFWELKSINLIEPGISWQKFKSFYKDNCKPLKSCFYNSKQSLLKKEKKMYDKFLNIKKNHKKDGVNIFFIPDGSMWTPVARAVSRGHLKKNDISNSRYIVIPRLTDLSGKGTYAEYKAGLPHELGHVLNLSHTKNNQNDLMYTGTSGATLTSKESNKARKMSKKIFK